ncbi:MAG: oxygenase MpaB family protein, partial [Parvularculaceae bacterium]|nr:oxygenase MpaB family protein [Parvularculaceae bacterium]
AEAMLTAPGVRRVDFASPLGEPALCAPDSVSWRVFKNPVTLFIGGVTAVLLEFAEPRVRSGVWEHSTFRTDPVGRLRRTGLAAMVTVYGARSIAERMIAGVVRMHDRVAGATPEGQAYHANDPALLNWVQATASFGFLEAYHRYAYRLSNAERDSFFAQSGTAAALYGAVGAPRCEAEWLTLLDATASTFERSDIVFEFLDIMRSAKALPGPAILAQGLLVRAAVEITPPVARRALGLDAGYALRPLERHLVKRMARRAEKLCLRTAPPAQACVRMGLPANYLYRA